jgi:aspartyl-tRNA(Asn)/glutamyl-tRNA(Gln) amidotransferase subunit B
MLRMINDGKISGKIGKIILPELVTSGRDAEVIVNERDMQRIADTALLKSVVDEVFAENRKAVDDAVRDDNAVNFLIGQVMKKTRGKADPQLVNSAVKEKVMRLREKNQGSA